MRSPWSGASSFGAAPNHQATHATPPDRNERPRPQASAAGHWRSRPDPSGSCGPRERTNTCVSPPTEGVHSAPFWAHCEAGIATLLRDGNFGASLTHIALSVRIHDLISAITLNS